MKRWICISLLVPMCLLASGRSVDAVSSEAVSSEISSSESRTVPAELQQFYQRIRTSCVTVDYSYSVNYGDSKVDGGGKAEVQGEDYRMTMNGVEIFCHKGTLWMLDREAQEVMVDQVAPGAADLLENPILFVSGIDSLFDISLSKGNFYERSDHFSVPSNKVVMIPRNPGEVLFLDVYYALDFKSIIGAVIYMKDGTITHIVVPSMKFLPLKEASHFMLDVSALGKSYVVTDIR